jgi:hypothetical protein
MILWFGYPNLPQSRQTMEYFTINNNDVSQMYEGGDGDIILDACTANIDPQYKERFINAIAQYGGIVLTAGQKLFHSLAGQEERNYPFITGSFIGTIVLETVAKECGYSISKNLSYFRECVN